MEKGFNKEGFARYLEHLYAGKEKAALRGVVEEIVSYALEHCHYSLDQACHFLAEILPEIDFADVAMYMDDSMLTYHGREVKREGLEALREQGGMDKVTDAVSDQFVPLDDAVSAASKVRDAEIAAFMDQMPPKMGVEEHGAPVYGGR